MAMDLDNFFQMDFCGYSSTTTTDEDYSRHWNDWSPVVDWEALSSEKDDFHDLIESMIDDSGLNHLAAGRVSNKTWNYSISSGTASSNTNSSMAVDEETNGEDFKGLRLVHLLIAAAEALTGVNKSRELARVILVRLKELASPNDGTNMERLAAYFTDALQGLLEGFAGIGVHTNRHSITNGGPHHRGELHHQNDVLAAFQLLQDMSPYVKFGHFTANQAILEAVTNDRRVHIVDYDIMEGIQWASFMQALVSRKDGPPAPHLRITALLRSGSGRRSISTVQDTGRRLVVFAASMGQPFSFHYCRLDSDETFKPSALKLVKGEALIINCMLHLPHFSYRAPDSIASFLSGSKTINPRLVIVVEEETGHVTNSGFEGRFMDLLHHYSAVYDSLEAGFPMQSRARALVERMFMGPRICGSLARIYRTRREEDCCHWSEWLGAVGFGPVHISFANHCQAKLLLGLFNDGYRVEKLANNKLVLGWKSRQLLSASVWTSSFDSNL